MSDKFSVVLYNFIWLQLLRSTKQEETSKFCSSLLPCSTAPAIYCVGMKQFSFAVTGFPEKSSLKSIFQFEVVFLLFSSTGFSFMAPVYFQRYVFFSVGFHSYNCNHTALLSLLSIEIMTSSIG